MKTTGTKHKTKFSKATGPKDLVSKLRKDLQKLPKEETRTVRAWAVLTSGKTGIARTHVIKRNAFPAIFRDRKKAQFEVKISGGGDLVVVPCTISYKLKRKEK